MESSFEYQIQSVLKAMLEDETNKKVAIYPYNFEEHPANLERPMIILKTARSSETTYLGSFTMPNTVTTVLVEITAIADNIYQAEALRNKIENAIVKWGNLVGLLVGGHFRHAMQPAGPMPAVSKNIDTPLWAYPLRLMFIASTKPGGIPMNWSTQYFVDNKIIEADDNGVFTIHDKVIPDSLRVFVDGLRVMPTDIIVEETEPFFKFRIANSTATRVLVGYRRG